MDPGTSAPSDDLRKRLSSALDNYRDEVFSINHNKLRVAVRAVQAQFPNYSYSLEEDDLGDGDERIWTLEDEYFHGEAAVLQRLSDVIAGGSWDLNDDSKIRFEQVLDPTVARRILPIAAPPQTRPPSNEEMQQLQRRVQAAAQTGEDATLPNEFIVLSSLVDSIFHPGLPAEFEASGDLIYRADLGHIVIQSLSELHKTLRLAEIGYKAFAGFLIDPMGCHGKNRPYFGWVLCKHAGTAEEEEKPKAWRIMFQYWDHHPPWVYDNVEEFLECYISFGTRYDKEE